MFVICGEALVDIFVDTSTQHSLNHFPLQACLGGSPFNVAIGLARLNQASALLASLSTDMFGERLLAMLKAEGVSSHYIVKKDLATTLAFVQQDDAGIPRYSFYGEHAADRALTYQDIQTQLSQNQHADITGFHLGSYTTVTPPIADALYQLVIAQAGKRLISLDPNIRTVVEPNIQRWQTYIEQLIPHTNILKVSDEDLALLYPQQAPEAIIQRWLSTGITLIALTRGKDGATLWSQTAQADVATPHVKVVDTVGAGDTFQAALLAQVSQLYQSDKAEWGARLSHATLKAIGNYAAQAAALTCTRQGADLPRYTELSPPSMG